MPQGLSISSASPPPFLKGDLEQVSSERDSSIDIRDLQGSFRQVYDHKRQEEARGKTQSSRETHQPVGCSASGCIRRVAKNEADAERKE